MDEEVGGDREEYYGWHLYFPGHEFSVDDDRYQLMLQFRTEIDGIMNEV
jgi:hypothetical protein